jgi:hypothetical protein
MRDFAMTKTKALLFLTCVVLAGCPSAKKDEQKNTNAGEYQEYKGDGFAVNCPNDIMIEKKKVIDFEIYSFTYRGKVILSAYAGNQPSFDNGEGKGGFFGRSKGQINGFPFKSIRSKKDGISKHEVLIDFGHTWPQYLHYWYSSGLPDDEKMIAESIIHSTKKL